jgi:hypothetical protein
MQFLGLEWTRDYGASVWGIFQKSGFYKFEVSWLEQNERQNWF